MVERDERLPNLRQTRRQIAGSFLLAWFIALGTLLGVALREGHARRTEQLDTELSLRATVIYGVAWLATDGHVVREVLDREPWSRDAKFPMRVLVWQPPLNGGPIEAFTAGYGDSLEPDVSERMHAVWTAIVDEDLQRWQGTVAGLRACALPMYDDDDRVVAIAWVTHDEASLGRELFRYSGGLIGAFVLLGLLGIFVSSRLAALSMEPLERTLQGRTRFIARAAHELRTPLASVRCVVDSALSGDEPPEVGLSRIANIVASTSRRVDTLLWHARLQSDDTSLLREPTRVDLLVEALLEDYPQATLHADPTTAEVDVALFEVALLNLLENAVRHGDGRDGQGVTVTVTAGRVCVEDRGTGLPQGFSQRPGGTRSTNPAGVGLGLDVVSAIARLHGGAIALDAAPNGGTSATLTFEA
ncbi:MAG: HAMP domain-containing sensor histidine kinase [Myxococcota bacterium]